MMHKKSIVVFYTWSGRTREMAEEIHRQTGADLLEVQPETPYSQNYHEVTMQAKDEIRRGYLPPLQNAECDLTAYEVVYVGSPIWWGTIAPPLATFLTNHDFDGKIVMPFSTHGGGGKGHSDKDIGKLCANTRVMKMFTVYEGGGASLSHDIAGWIKETEVM